MPKPDKPLTVWLFTSSYAPHLGGLENVVAQLAAGLQTQGHTVRVFTQRSPRTLPAHETLNGVAVERWFFLWPLWEDLRRGRLDLFLAGLALALLTWLRLLWRIARAKPDVINTHFASLPALFVALAHYGQPFRLVLTLHGDDVEGAPHRSAFYRWLLRFTARRAEVVTACSRYLLAAAAQQVPEISGKSCPTPNGLDLPLVPMAPSAQRLIIVGRLVPKKGHAVLLQAYAQLTTPPPLWIVGLGPEEARLKALAQSLALPVTFCGPLPYTEMLQLMASSLGVIVPSLQEPFGLVALEALALGKPVVASQVGGLPEVLQEAEALLVPPNDPTALAQALAQLLARLQHQPTWGAHNRQHAAKFSTAHMVAAYLSTYQ